MLAFLAVLKLYPAYFLLLGLVLRRRRFFTGFLLGFTTLTLLAIAVLGWASHAEFLIQVLPVTGGGTGWVENQTFTGFFTRLLGNTIALAPSPPGLVTLLSGAGHCCSR